MIITALVKVKEPNLLSVAVRLRLDGFQYLQRASLPSTLSLSLRTLRTPERQNAFYVYCSLSIDSAVCARD